MFSGNYNYLREGANQALNTLVRYLEGRSGCSVRVYSPVSDSPAFEPAGTLVPVPSIALPVRNEFRLALRLNGALRDDIRQFHPDVIHVSTPDILGCRAQTLARTMAVPVVASMHTRFETYLEYYRLGWARPLLDAHLRRFYRRSDHVVAPTSTLVGELMAMRGDARASLWSRGIDTELFRPDRRDLAWRRAQGIADDEVALLFFGRLVLEKGIATYISVVNRLHERGVRIRPLVVGTGPAAQRFARLPSAVLTGHLSGDDLARAIASADILLNPSTTETFGNVIVEAMASGVPVVSADAQNSRCILSHGKDGLLCPAGETDAYVDAIEALAKAKVLRLDMGSAARRKSMRYSWDTASESVVQVYRSFAQTRRSYHSS